jgi:hypothetical protein
VGGRRALVTLALATALAACGSTTTTTTTAVTATGAVTLTVTSPTSGSVIGADSVTVTGTVTPINAVVQIAGTAAAIGNGVFTGAATLHSGKTTIPIVGSAPGETPASTSIVVYSETPAAAAAQPKPAAKPATATSSATPGVAYESPGSGAGETSCGNGLQVGPDTTCAFAQNVEQSYDNSGAGEQTVYSPVTHQTYEMNCVPGNPVVCTGGNNASVYFP